MNKLMMIVGMVAMVGCVTMTPEERRAAYAKEYERLAHMPEGRLVVSPDRNIATIARASCDFFAEVHTEMVAYVTHTENCREYTGFMNDVAYYVKEEKMTNDQAFQKVKADVLAADAVLPAEEQVWPRVVKGIRSAKELDPAKRLARISVLILRNKDLVKSCKKLPDAFKQGDMMSKIQRGAECAAITSQLADGLACLTFLSDQYSRVQELENYAE